MYKDIIIILNNYFFIEKKCQFKECAARKMITITPGQKMAFLQRLTFMLNKFHFSLFILCIQSMIILILIIFN